MTDYSLSIATQGLLGFHAGGTSIPWPTHIATQGLLNDTADGEGRRQGGGGAPAASAGFKGALLPPAPWQAPGQRLRSRQEREEEEIALLIALIER